MKSNMKVFPFTILLALIFIAQSNIGEAVVLENAHVRLTFSETNYALEKMEDIDNNVSC